MVKVALAQMCSGRDPAANLAVAEGLIRDAAAAGGDVVCTPEMTNIIANREDVLAAVLPEAEDPFVARLRELARELGIVISAGSLAVRADADRLANRSLLIDRDGTVVARYDKIHMFDVDLGTGERYTESRTYRPGTAAVAGEAGGCRFGLTVCYDMRFAPLYRSLAHAGAELITVPSAFTRPTGEAHWHVLLRARAIETGAFVLAAAQTGEHENGRKTYGHSLAVDPWGRVLADGGSDTGLVFADCDLDEVGVARRRIPALEHDRAFSGPAVGKTEIAS